jgi:hypothetical protein
MNLGAGLMTTQTLKRSFYTFLITLLAGACSGGGGCGGCGMEPLPAGGLPGDQTIEGGAQLRISDTGFQTITDIIPAVLQDTLGQGVCIPEGGFSVINYCYQNDGSCTDGCQTDINIDFVNLDVPNDDTLRLDAQFDVHIDVPAEADLGFLGSPSCDIIATANNIRFNVDIGFDIDPATGELELNLQQISDVNININIDASDCGVIIDAVASLVSGIINGIGSILDVAFIRDLLTPVLEPIIQGLLPDPLGIEGIADVGALIGDVSPGTRARMETRIVPGGYVHLENDGLSLGIITGINADEDLDTRTADLDSEPALCVPPFAAPDFGAAPASLASNARGNFLLNPANLFRGDPETVSDVLVGASETMLDQLGHHVISSGALCLSLGTELVEQLNLGTIAILVPSLAELGTEEGDDPLLLVTRPAKPIDFTIGDGTEASPSLTLHLSEFNIDFYAFIFERYTRGFTVTLDMNVGINLDFTTDGDGNPAVMPILVGLESENIGVTVLNEEFLAEDRADLEAVFPILLDLILPLVGDGLGAFSLPELAGFQLDNLGIQRVTTSEDDFLAISASLGAGSMMNALGQMYPSVAVLVEDMQMTKGTPATAGARLVDVIAPTPVEMVAALKNQPGGKAPGVVLDLDTHDQMGRELEWTWNIEGGIWRPLIEGGQVTLRDGAFNIQGKYELQFRSRAVGDYHTWDREITSIDVVIDSVGPRILTKSIERKNETLIVSAFDAVFEREVEIAFGPKDAESPTTEWSAEGRIAMEHALSLAEDGELRIFSRDPLGNESSSDYRLSNAFVASATGGCSTGGTTGYAGLLLVLLFLGLRMRKQLPAPSMLGLVLVTALSAQACNCGSDPNALSCDIDEDCIGLCEEGEIGQCLDGLCRCLSDVPYGPIGQYSSMDVAADGTVWVSAYNSEHGDLMVASTREMGRIPNETWQFIDGVPEGPVVLPPFSVRGGIKAEGEDVGQYTDLAIAPDGTVMISYFDASTGSLKFTANHGGEWHNHVVDAGDLSDDDANTSKLAGQYSSISIDSNGVPAIAYFAHVGIGTEEATTEVRFAQATSSDPRSGGTWTVTAIDEALVPATEAEADVLTIPYGTGLFVELVRDNNDLPITAYYDRINGELKLARFDDTASEFTVESLDAQGDVGWYPSVVVDLEGTVHVSYVDAINKDLLYINDADRVTELVDDGYRLVGTTEDGLPIPEFHFVGDDSSIVLTPDSLYVAYQDATTHELLVAYPTDTGAWGRSAIAGDEAPFVGAYGFYANATFDGTDVTMSSWVLDQANADNWVELFRRSVIIE